MKLLEIHQVSKRFPIEGGVFHTPVGFVQALQNVSLSIEKGDTLALVGGSGCGKSTLAKIIVGLLEPDVGELLWEGRSLQNFNRLERAQRIQMIFQDPYASLNPKLSIGTQLSEVVRLASSPLVGEDTGGGGKTARNPPSQPSPTKGEGVHKRCAELLDSVGLPADVLSHYPFQFSGGQRQRIAIARALAMKPELLIADEPLSSLDVTTQAQILELFARLRASYGLTFLFITHDLAVAYQFANRVIVLQEGRIVEEGAASSVLRNPQHLYTQSLLAAVPRIPC